MSEVKKETKTKKATTKKTKTTKEETKVVKKVATKKEPKKEEKVEVKKEEKKVKKALMDDKSQIYYRSLSKIIKILAKIVRIFLMICVPFIFLAMIIIPIIFKDFEIDANIIRLDGVTLIVNSDKFTVKINEETKVFKADAKVLDDITTFLSENTKGSIITFIELSLLLFAIILIIYIYLLMNLEKIFGNFVKNKTPFIKENSKYIFKIAILTCVLKFINFCLTTANLNAIRIDAVSILGILIIFVIYIVYNYAVKLQSKTDDTLYE